MSVFDPKQDAAALETVVDRLVAGLQATLAALVDPFEQAGARLISKAGEVFEPIGQRLVSAALDRLETKTIPLIKAELLGLTVSSSASLTITEKQEK